jgi:transcriptional regulator with XRE-family HTH domain
MATAVRNRRPALAQAVRARRRAYGWSQPELARRAGLHKNTVQKIEGPDGNPTADILLRLAGALGCGLDDLFWSEDEDAA